VALLALLGAVSLVLVAPPPVHAIGGPLRVLITGDSITQGRNDEYTWRYRLAKEFQRQGVPVDFVGSYTNPWVDPGYRSSRYLDPHFDHDHFAKAGWQVRNMVSSIGAEVRKQQPDVIVMAAGTLDFRRHDDDPATETALRAWIAAVQSAKPDTRIILSPVLSVDSKGAAGYNPRIARYDADLPGIAAELSTLLSPITVAATTQGWDPRRMTYDGIHPTPSAETLIEQRIAEEFQRVGLLPQAPQAHRSVAWSPKHVPNVRIVGTRATVSWSKQAVTGGRIWVHQLGHKARASGWYATGKHDVTVVGGATYEFRLQVRRLRMTSTWGPIRKVVAPAAPARVRIGKSVVQWTKGRGATSYSVQIRKIGSKHWTTRHTTGLKLAATRVAAVKVRSVNSSGDSLWREARR
jgi:lysophospholipase L1-like esterase